MPKSSSFLMPPLGHNSDIKRKPGPIVLEKADYPEEKWGTLSYIDKDGKDVTMKVPLEQCDYGMIYDNIEDMLTNGAQKVVKDEEVVAVLRIIEQGIQKAKEAK